ncbi:MAG: radical SAM protein [Candidatus Omnitrophota bacterium]
MTKEYIPRLIAWEMTKECKLSCEHCRISSIGNDLTRDLTTGEGKKVLKGIAAYFKPIIIMTGGDPVLRKDFLEIAAFGSSLGLKMVVASCGYGLTLEFAKKMKDAGILAVSLSIDGENEEAHDAFRNQQGSFKMVIEAANTLKQAELNFQINTTVTKKNAASLDNILAIAKKLGAKQFHPFMFVPTGKGKNISNHSLSADEYEKALTHIHGLAEKETDLQFKPTCAPQYNRIVLQNTYDKEVSHGKLGSGCMGGKSFAFISSYGEVKICGFLNVVAGRLPEHNYNFYDIWQNSELFNRLRNFDNYNGKCGVCGYRSVCGGCRARAYEENGDYLGEEPFCVFDNTRQAVT